MRLEVNTGGEMKKDLISDYERTVEEVKNTLKICSLEKVKNIFEECLSRIVEDVSKNCSVEDVEKILEKCSLEKAKYVCLKGKVRAVLEGCLSAKLKSISGNISVEEIKEILESCLESAEQEEISLSIIKGLSKIIWRSDNYPLIILPELYSDSEETYAIKIEEALELLWSKYISLEFKPNEILFVPLAASGIICKVLTQFLESNNYPSESLLRDLQKIDLLSLKTFILLLKETKIQFGILVISPECTPEIEELKIIEAASTVFYLDNGINLLLVSGEIFRKLLKNPDAGNLKSFHLRGSDLYRGLLTFTKTFPFPGETLKLFRIIDSPLSRKVPPKTVFPPDIPMRKVGMNQLKASYVTLEDLKRGDKVVDEDEKKLIWNGVSKKQLLDSPAIRRNDILITIKRKTNFNVAFICEKTPETDREIFIAKPDMAIIRLNPEEFSAKEIENFFKLLMAEFKTFPSNNNPAKKTLNINILRNVVGELVVDETFRKFLREENLEKLMVDGRKILKGKLLKYLNASSLRA